MTVCYWCGAKDTLADIGKELDDGKYKMVQCQKCKNAYYVLNKAKQKTNEKTNEEYLKSCTTEQLAKVLLSFCQYPCEICKIECDGGNACTYNKALNTIVAWLKQPHTKGVKHDNQRTQFKRPEKSLETILEDAK